MSVELISVKCPECGASLDIEEGRRQMFCSYCGAKRKKEAASLTPEQPAPAAMT